MLIIVILFKAIIDRLGPKSTRESFNKWREMAMKFGLGKKFDNDYSMN